MHPLRPSVRAADDGVRAVNPRAVMQFVEREFGVRLSSRATGEYLRRWGFTPQKPTKRAYEQRPEAVKQWLDQRYPAIKRRAKAEAVKSTGAKRRRWSTPTCPGAATRRATRPQ
jgi:hypothetical protein